MGGYTPYGIDEEPASEEDAKRQAEERRREFVANGKSLPGETSVKPKPQDAEPYSDAVS